VFKSVLEVFVATLQPTNNCQSFEGKNKQLI